uniref:Zinc finger PHD-type domain-containing protein n=1 Tax=Anas platyrhynchos TaxID=8839 RepID=A0A8B9TX87_ANAPL
MLPTRGSEVREKYPFSQQGPSAPWQGGPRLGCGCLLGPFPSTASGPAHQPAWQGQNRPLGTVPRGHLAPQRCSMAEPFSLSPPACMLCGRVDVDDKLLLWQTSLVHQAGLQSVPCTLCPALPRGVGSAVAASSLLLMGLLCSLQQCFVCGERGATITCTVRGCERCFHLPCASEGECVTQYCGQYRSFCSEHRPQQAAQAAPEQGTTCIICMEPVGDSTSYHTMVCPTCNHAWFHRRCIQVGALPSPWPAHRSPPVFLLVSLYPRHQRCDASECLYPRGREQAEVHGPWQLLLCRSCAAEGTHRRCSNLTNRAGTWECASCAGVDNGKTHRPHAAGLQGLRAALPESL